MRNFPTFNGVGSIGNTTGLETSFAIRFVNILSQIIGVMTIIGALWFLFQLFSGAIHWIGAGSDKQALDNAKKRISNALVGLFVIVAGYALLGVVGYFLGLDILNLAALINSVAP